MGVDALVALLCGAQLMFALRQWRGEWAGCGIGEWGVGPGEWAGCDDDITTWYTRYDMEGCGIGGQGATSLNSSSGTATQAGLVSSH
jgi:hypothetical protein